MHRKQYYQPIQSSFRTVRGASALAIALLFLACPVQAKEEKHFLWRTMVGDSEIYLLGSIHAANESFYPMASVIENAFKKSDRLLLELDLGEINLPEVQQKMLQRALYTDGRTLKDVFSPNEFAALHIALGRFGINLEQLVHFQPWFISLTLSQVFIQAIGLDMNAGIDLYFYSKAFDSKMIHALETIDMQLDMLSTFDMEMQKALLQFTVEDLENFAQQMDALIDMWRRGDAEGMDAVLREPLEENPEFNVVFEKMFTERNVKMTRKLERLAKRFPATYFVVVGAGHLVGETGMVTLLRAEGYTVEQL